MSQQYLKFNTSCCDHSDSIGLERFDSAKEAIFNLITECARYEVDNDNPCIAVLLEKLTVENENEIEQKINERIEYLNKGFDMENDEEKATYWDDAKCSCVHFVADSNIPNLKENITHEGYAYQFWTMRESLISTLKKKDLHVDMGELFPSGLFHHCYYTSGNRKNREEILISMGHERGRGLKYVETISK